jgi:23S rRNA (pseudouridine1915-N3)-methyltransferase
MRISIVAIGRMKQGPGRELMLRYVELAVGSGRGLGLSGFDVTEIAESRAATPQKRKSDEAAAITAALGSADVVIALDEHGKTMGSEDFAKRIGRWRDDGKASLAFVIGGPDGLDPDFVKRATLSLSFSPLTWPHQLVRVMLAEQLYRATTILAGHPYHRE